MIQKVIPENIERSIWSRDAFLVTPKLFRMLVVLSGFAWAAVYSTGYLREIILLMAAPALVMLILGRGLIRFPKLVQVLSVLVMFYSLTVLQSNVFGVIVLIEFASLILFLQLQVATSSRTVGGVIVLSLMIILAVAAMNVNFLLPLSLFPYLMVLGLVLAKISFLWHKKNANEKVQAVFFKSGFLFKPWKYVVILIAYLFFWVSLFYLVPRTEAYGLASETSKRRLTGFSESLKLGERGLLEDNPAVVMRIRPADAQGISSSIVRRMRSKLLRGTTFVNYSGGDWSRGQSRRYYIDLRKTHGQFNMVESWPAGKKLFQVEVILENTDPPVIFVPDQTMVAEFDASFIAVENDQSMYFLGKTSGRRRYLCRMLIDPVEVNDVPVNDLELHGYMRVYLSRIGIDQKIQGLADQISSSTFTIGQRVKATMQYLRENCTYSLYETSSGGNDPTAHFLFNSKSGSCEHFASAMTLLLRAMKIPARPVNGYTMGDWNELGGFFTVRQRNAHTWVEVFFPDTGWVPFDPSPPEENFVPEGEIQKLLAYLWEVYEGHWFNFVYNFDQNTQMLGFKKISKSIESYFGKFKETLRQQIWLLAPGLLIFFLILNRISRAISRRSSSWMPDWYCQWVSGLDASRMRWETPLEFHRRLIEEGVVPGEFEAELEDLALLVDKSALENADNRNLTSQAMQLLKKIGS